MSIIEYYDYLKPNFINTALIINYNDNSNTTNSATLQSNSFGVITLNNNKIEVHIWESEEQVTSISYLSKRFSTVLLNGITYDKNLQNSIISEVKRFIYKQNIKINEYKIVQTLFDILEKTE